MKKILVSVAAATMALSTTASALEDIKVNGQAKLWYETDNKGNGDRSVFNQDSASGEVVFKLGMTGKQGDVGFGATVYQGSTMGLENQVVSGVRTNANELVNTSGNGDMFVGEAYFTAPIAPDTVLKFGKQELDTPLAFTERWNAMPNTFNAAVAINSSIENLTLIGAYVGQDNATGFKADDTFASFFNTALAVGGLYKQDNMAANLWLYRINAEAMDANIYAGWLDASMKLGDANVKGYAAYVTHTATGAEDTMAFAASADMKISDITLFGAASYVSDGDIGVANTSTNKKTMLPTQGIYTDGVYVAQPGSTAVKVSASTKLGDTGVSLNAVHNMNSDNDPLETTEIYATVKQKVGAFDLLGIVMHRMMGDDATDDAQGGQYVRVVASVNF